LEKIVYSVGVFSDTNTKMHKRKEKKTVNKALLEYKMKENGKSISDMCEMLKISRSAFYRKCNGKSEFTHSEICKIVDYLKLDSPVDIFFA
jgi:predicted transcriptional regulator